LGKSNKGVIASGGVRVNNDFMHQKRAPRKKSIP
jgi:hypothetical protein